MSEPVLVVRPDSVGDVLLAGPAVRAVAASGRPVLVLASPRGAPAAELLPGPAGVLVHRLPWIEPDPQPVSRTSVDRLIADVAGHGITEAVVLTSFHQSALPTALVLRLAGVRRITAISEDYPGALLDVRVPDPGDLPEPERALAVAAAAGFRLPSSDDGRLAVRRPLPDVTGISGGGGYVVMHPGTSVPARAWPAEAAAAAVDRLAAAGRRVLVTGGPGESGLTRRVAGAAGVDLGGRTGLPELAALLAGADAVVAGNTGPAHLAAAVGTPVVSLFAPTVPAVRWAPYRVPLVLLGDQRAGCRDSRATVCPIPGHPCLAGVRPEQVVEAVDRLAGARVEVPA